MTNYEKETIILFNEAEPTAEIETYSSRLIGKLNRLAKERPDEVIVKDGNVGSMRYVVPKKWVTVSAPRIMSDEEKAICAERLAKARRINSEVG